MTEAIVSDAIAAFACLEARLRCALGRGVCGDAADAAVALAASSANS